MRLVRIAQKIFQTLHDSANTPAEHPHDRREKRELLYDPEVYRNRQPERIRLPLRTMLEAGRLQNFNERRPRDSMRRVPKHNPRCKWHP
jgi:hypothetical protein